MSQPSVAAFFNTRKRAIQDTKILKIQQDVIQEKSCDRNTRTRSGRQMKRSADEDTAVKELPKKTLRKTNDVQQKLVEFIKKGPLSPRKKTPIKLQNVTIQEKNEKTPSTNETSLKNITNNDDFTSQIGMRTPTKQIIKIDKTNALSSISKSNVRNLVKKELDFGEVKSKISRSEKLQELKASLNRLQKLETLRKSQEENNKKKNNACPEPPKQAPVVQLKEFGTIELEVLTR